MMEKKSKKLYWGFKILSIIVSCALPLWAICEKFPIWQVEHGTTHTIGMGMILAAFVLLVIFRKTVFNFIIDHLDLRHAPPLSVWLVMLIVSYTLVYIGEIMRDMTNVFWMGFIGCVIGTFLTYVSERFKTKDVNSNE